MARACLTLLPLLLLASRACAWDAMGHMMVAAAAWQQLTPAARAQAGALLAGSPAYGLWTHGATGARAARQALLLASAWADDIKSAPDYTDEGDRPDAPGAGAVGGYADHRRHRYWHYISVPLSPDGTPTVPAAAPNVLTQISALSAVLADPRADAARRSYALVWLLHLVGDAHQPLHAVSRFTHAQPRGDEGGNQVALACPRRVRHCARDLHAFWDQLPGRGHSPRAAWRRAAQLPDADPAQAALDDPAVWVRQSVQLAGARAYAAPIGAGPGPWQIDSAYARQARATARAQLALAAARLARLLNQRLQ